MRASIVFAAILAVASAKVMEFEPCSDASVCSVSDLRLEPCTAKKACKFYLGANASISFNFTPRFSSSELQTKVFYESSQGPLEFAGMGSNNGCEYTSCPVTAGTPQQFNYNLYIGKKLPQGDFPLKWVVWNQGNDKEACCLRFPIKLKKSKAKK